MSEPAIPHASHSATGYVDGLGRRTIEFDREAGGMLERLHLRAEFGAFEAAMRQRMDRLAACDDARIARVRAVERTSAGLSVVSAYVAGDRLCDLLEAATNLPADEATSPTVDAALGFLLEVLPALAALHSATGVAHGAVAPGRITITASGDIVLLDTMYGDALHRLQYNRRRLWTDFGLAMPPAVGPARFDCVADTSQAALAAMMIVLGRPFRPDDYPDALPALITEVIEIAQIRGSARFATGLHKFLHRALPLPARRPHASADEAAAEVRQVAKEIGAPRCRAALTAFVDDMNRVISEAREQRLSEHLPSSDVPFVPAPDVTLALDEPVLACIDSLPDAPIEVAAESVPEPLAELGYQPAAAGEVLEDAADSIDHAAERVSFDAPEPEPVTFAESNRVIAAPPPEHSREVAEEPAPEPAFDPPLPAIAAVTAADEPPPVMVSAPEPALTPIAVVEPPPAPIAVLEAPRIAVVAPPPPVPVIEAPPASAAAAAELAPVPVPVTVPVPVPMSGPPPAPTVAKQAEPQPEPERAPADSKRKRHNARRHRDKLRSNATPPPPPAPLRTTATPPAGPPVRTPLAPPAAPRMPVYDAPVAAVPNFAPPPSPPRKTAQPLRDESPLAAPVLPVAPVTPIRLEPPAASPTASAPLAFKSDPAGASAPLTFKNSAPSGFAPARSERRESHDMMAVPYGERSFEEAPGKRSVPWRLVAAAVVIIAVGIGAGRKYLPNSGAAAAAPIPSAEVVDAAKVAAASEKYGTVVLTTEPAGAHVLLDGKEMGDSPLTLENVPAGKHALTFVTASASVKKIVRVEAGKTVGLDVAVFSGWIAVFSPIPLDISENGRAIGSSEQGRLMLSPGRHRLTLTNSELGYSDVKMVDIEPGEEHPLSVEPSGVLSANAVPWAEVWMNGKKIGETPVARLMVPLGTHEVVFKNPQFPERRVSVTVTATTPVAASVDFSK